MKMQKFYLYEDRRDVSLTAYLLAEEGELRGQGKRPGVLICPGGGYFDCSDREADPVAMAYAAMGYHTFVLRYSTYNQGKGVFPDISKPIPPKPETVHPAPVREIGMAMLLLREHAGDWMLDMEKIAVCGFSAGGHNAAMYGVYWDKPLLTDFLKVDKEQLRPAALILGYALTDYIFMRDNGFTDAMTEGFFAASNTAFLGEAAPSDERLLEVSPARLVDANTPPTFLWATSEDGLVPVGHTTRMANALAEKGIPFEVHIFEKGDHGLSVASQSSAMAKSQLNVDAAKWVALSCSWLEKRFALDLPEMTDFEKSIL